MVVISDTSCLIVLRKINRLDLLNALYGVITIPRTIAEECKFSLPYWVNVVDDPQTSVLGELRQQLDPGEAAAIALAANQPDCLLIIDETKGRMIAKARNVAIIGTLGIFLKAKEAGLVNSVQAILMELRNNTDFWFSDKLASSILARAGEL